MFWDSEKVRTVVLKIGTNLLSGKRAFDGRVMEQVVQEICALKRERDLNVLVVSSGAVGCGMKALGLCKRPTALPEKQAVAAVGQSALMHLYESLFLAHGDGLTAAQVLLTLDDLDRRENYLNVRNTLNTLLSMKRVVPILNENDSTAVKELRFGDNDTLAAKIAAKLNADLLIILTDIDGLYDRAPNLPGATLVTHVEKITSELEAAAGGAGSIASTGGMRTKLEAAKIACAAGVAVAIANGHHPNVVHGVLEGTLPCTAFAASGNAMPHWKRWIAFGRATKGAVYVDAGARRALVEQGKSLLAAGITAIEGGFKVGDAIEIRDPEGQAIARALTNYAAEELERIKGRRSGEIADILGHKDFDEAAHRDNMVVL